MTHTMAAHQGYRRLLPVSALIVATSTIVLTTDHAHSFSGDNDPLQSPELGQAKGFVVDAALKTADGIEWSFSGRAPFFPWYAVLNNGRRVTGTGGEDSMSDLHVSKLVGSART
jgi:hypothetical protein